MSDAQSEIGEQLAEQNKPACPLCGKRKHVRVNGFRDFTCLGCKMDFDGEDDGDVGYGRPSKRMERGERRKSKGR